MRKTRIIDVTNVKKYFFGVLVCFFSMVCSFASDDAPNVSTGAYAKSHHIEIEKNKDGVPIKVKFVSPDGKRIKSLLFNDVIIAGSGKSLIYQASYSTHRDMGYDEYERELFNAEAKIQWRKRWKSFPGYESGYDEEQGMISGWFEGISYNGERSYVTYLSSAGIYNLVVISETGKELARAESTELLYDIAISPDGRIVASKLPLGSGNHEYQRILFLDVDSGKTKVVKVEGENWEGEFNVSSRDPLLFGKILLSYQEKVKPNSYKRFYVKFDDLPEDIRALVQNKGK